MPPTILNLTLVPSLVENSYKVLSMGPFTLILDKGLPLAILRRKLSFGINSESLLEKKKSLHKEANFGQLGYVMLCITIFSVNFFDLKKSPFLQIHAGDTILISPMTF